MNMIRLTAAVAWKEIQVLFKDRGALALYLLMPLLLAGLIGGPQINSWQNEEDGPNITLGLVVVNEDAGAYGTQLKEALEQVEFFEVQSEGEPGAADALVADREVDAALIIPADFSQQVENFAPADVQLVVDPGQKQTVGLISGIVNGIVSEFNLVSEIRYGVHTIMEESGVMAGADPALQQAAEAQTLGVIMTTLNEKRANPAISLVSEDISGHSRDEYLNLILVAMIPGFAILFAYTVATSVAETMFVEKENGSFRRLLAAPISPTAVIAGKMVAYMLLIGLQILMIILVGSLFFDMPTGQSPLALVVVTFVLALSVTAVGMFLAAVTKNKRQVNTLGILLMLVMAFIGGCLVGMPEMLVFRSQSFMGTLARLTPHGNVLEAYVRIMGEGAGIVDVLPQIGTLLGMSLLLYLIAIWRFRFE